MDCFVFDHFGYSVNITSAFVML
uniref:Uncharacterized protein n=1 Tax=Arundo donax TaxID=35708 RepID=A0A0A8ZJ32_ARUDO